MLSSWLSGGPPFRHLLAPFFGSRHDRIVDAPKDLPFPVLADELVFIKARENRRRVATVARSTVRCRDLAVARSRHLDLHVETAGTA